MATRKKVFLVITKAVLGGAQRYVFDVARLLPRDAYDVTVCSGEKGWLHEVCTREGVASVSLSSFGRDVALGKDVRAFFELLSLFAKERPDIVHLNSSKVGAMGALAARIAGVQRIIFTAHGWAFNENRPSWQKLLIRLAAWATVLLSDKTICVSESLRRDMAGFPFVHKKLRVVHLGIEPFETEPKSEARAFLAEKTGATRDEFWFGTIAELHPNKGLDVGIRAFKKTDMNARWIIIGGGEEASALKTLAEDDPRIYFVGALENARAHLPAFDAFFLPSRTEAFGGVILEAGFAGVPVIASNAGGIAEVLDGGACGLLFEKENIDDAAAAIRTFSADPAMRSMYAEKLKKRVTESYTSAKMLHGTLDSYEGRATST